MLAQFDQRRSVVGRMFGAALGVVVAVAIAAPSLAQTQRADVEDVIRQFLVSHPEVLEPVIEKYFAEHPEAVRDAIVALMAKRKPASTPNIDAKQAIADNAKALYAAPLQTAVGAADGALTIVEFFDFNCGYCRKAAADILTLIAEDPGVRIVLKELPVLGPPSVEAAKVAIALQMRRPDAATSLEFHRRLLAMRGRIDRAAALAVVVELGFDSATVEKDAESAEVNEVLQQNMQLASALGIRGTPGYVIGDNVIPGAVGASALKARVDALKKR